MVRNNSTALSSFITSPTTSSTNFGVLVYVVGPLDPSIDDPNSCTILLPNSNSNGNPHVDSSMLGGTYSFANLHSSKASCVATLFVCSSIACSLYYVYCCCYCKCCCKC
jgi:hypothetical protein